MWRTCFIAVAVLILFSACKTQPVSEKSLTYPPFQGEPARNGEILVIIPGGPVTNNGERWFPEGSSLATVLDWAGISQDWPPRKVTVVNTNGHAVRYRVDGRPRKELEQIKLKHGTVIIVPRDRCFGFVPRQISGMQNITNCRAIMVDASNSQVSQC